MGSLRKLVSYLSVAFQGVRFLVCHEADAGQFNNTTFLNVALYGAAVGHQKTEKKTKKTTEQINHPKKKGFKGLSRAATWLQFAHVCNCRGIHFVSLHSSLSVKYDDLQQLDYNNIKNQKICLNTRHRPFERHRIFERNLPSLSALHTARDIFFSPAYR